MESESTYRGIMNEPMNDALYVRRTLGDVIKQDFQDFFRFGLVTQRAVDRIDKLLGK
jgi:hypothetical protein